MRRKSNLLFILCAITLCACNREPKIQADMLCGDDFRITAIDDPRHKNLVIERINNKNNNNVLSDLLPEIGAQTKIELKKQDKFFTPNKKNPEMQYRNDNIGMNIRSYYDDNTRNIVSKLDLTKPDCPDCKTVTLPCVRIVHKIEDTNI